MSPRQYSTSMLRSCCGKLSHTRDRYLKKEASTTERNVLGTDFLRQVAPHAFDPAWIQKVAKLNTPSIVPCPRCKGVMVRASEENGGTEVCQICSGSGLTG